MAGPWEKFQKQAPAADGPWSKFAAQAPVEPAPEAPQPQAPETEARPKMAALEGAANGALQGYLPQLQAAVEPLTTKVLDAVTGGDVSKDLPDYTARRDQAVAHKDALDSENPWAHRLGTAAGALGSAALMPGVSGVKGAAAMGALQGAVSNPGDTRGEAPGLQVGDRLRNLLVGGATGGALAGAGKAAGGVADRLMQSAVGIRKARDGLGTELLDQGLWGSKSGMQKQVDNMIASKGEALNGLVKGIDSPIDMIPVADKMADAYVNQFGLGKVAPNLEGPASKYADMGDYLATRESMSPQNALKFKRGQQQEGFTAAQTSGNTHNADVARLAARETGKAIENAYQAQNPGSTQLKDLNTNIAALYKAKHGLGLGDSLSTQLSSLGLGAIGAMAKGVATGAILGQAARSPLAKSAAAQTISKGGKALTPEVAKYLTELETDALRDNKQ